MTDNSNKILLIEDNQGDARLVREMLVEEKSVPFELEHADRLSTGLERISKKGIDVVLLDLGLPDSRGFETFSKAYSYASNLPIVVLTGMNDEELAVNAMRHGAADYLIKDQMDTHILTRSIRYAIERKNAERMLHHREDHFRSLIQNSPDIIMALNPDGSIRYVSPSVERLLGYKPQDLAGRNAMEFIHPYNVSNVIDVLSRGLQTRGLIESMEFCAQHKNGSWRIFEGISKSYLAEPGVAYIVNVRDITERKRMEIELKESEERYQMLVERNPNAMIVYCEGKIVFSNYAGAKLLGASDPERLVGISVKDIVHPGHWDSFMEQNRQMIDGGKEIPLTEEKLIGFDGRVIDVEMASTPFTYKGRFAIQSVVLDITEKKMKIQENKRLEDEHLKYASKANFLENMSPPLRTTIRFLEIMKLKTAGELNEKQEHFVDYALANSKFMLNFVNRNLDLAMIEAGSIELAIEWFDVMKAIKEVAVMTKVKASKRNITLKKEFDPELEFIEADRLRFKQILFNLLSNAVKFSKEEGGTITITTKKLVDMASFSVSDTGIGIREDEMGKIFTAFEQPDSGVSRNDNTGVGLVISKKLVELHGGRIWAESKYGEGSTFNFLLPLAAKNAGGIK